jgi:hypothetical protein
MRSLAVAKLQCPSEGAYPLLNLQGARAMFGFRPYVPGFNVEPPAEPEVPGFRMNADGSVRTDDAASGQPRSYTPVGWSSVSDQLGNAEIALGNSYGSSYWNDLWDAAKQLGSGANAVVNGAYSLGPGTFYLAREAGRGLGLFGPDEAQRFRQEMNAAGLGLRAIAKNPGTAARMAGEGLLTAVKKEPLLPFYVLGRAGMGGLLASRGVPIAPFAVLGDALHALEKGHDVIDALGYGVSGTQPTGR